jgi:hypothetical protein
MWTFTLGQTFISCLGKHNERVSLWNEGLGVHVPLHDTVQWWMNPVHDGHDDAKDSPSSGAPATATGLCSKKTIA